MAKAKGTGIGISSENVGPVVTLALNKILQVEAENLRRYAPNQKAIEEMAESIKQFGLMNPLLVKEIPLEGVHEADGYMTTHKLVAGHQRFKALMLIAGDNPEFEVPVHIAPVQSADQENSQMLNLEENVRRNELSYIDLAYAVQTMKEQGISTADIAKRIGKTGAWISYVLKFLTLREAVQKKIHEGIIPFRLARVLSSLDEKEQDARIKAVEDGGGATEQAEEAVTKRGKKKNKGRKAKGDEPAGAEKKGLSAKKAVLWLVEIVGGIKEQEKLTKKDEALITLFTLQAKFLEGKIGVKAYQNKVAELV